MSTTTTNQVSTSTSQRDPNTRRRPDYRFSELIPPSIVEGKVFTVIGCGATGSYLAPLLYRLGPGRINLIDFDTVQPENLGTQNFPASAVGKPKATALADLLSSLAHDDHISPPVTPYNFRFLDHFPHTAVRPPGSPNIGYSFCALNLPTISPQARTPWKDKLQKANEWDLTKELLHTTDVFFICVDNMDFRNSLLPALTAMHRYVPRWSGDKKIIIDPRLGGKTVRLIAGNTGHEDFNAYYQSVLFPDSEMEQLPCSGRMTPWAPAMGASLCCSVALEYLANPIRGITDMTFAMPLGHLFNKTNPLSYFDTPALPASTSSLIDSILGAPPPPTPTPTPSEGEDPPSEHISGMVGAYHETLQRVRSVWTGQHTGPLTPSPVGGEPGVSFVVLDNLSDDLQSDHEEGEGSDPEDSSLSERIAAESIEEL